MQENEDVGPDLDQAYKASGAQGRTKHVSAVPGVTDSGVGRGIELQVYQIRKLPKYITGWNYWSQHTGK